MTLPPALLAVLALATLVLFGALCALTGAAWMKARAADALRTATDERLRLLALADHWIWETDAEHRLTLWRVPAQCPAGWRVEPPLGMPLARLESAAAPTPLARQMRAGAVLADQRVQWTLGATAQTWCLRGQPRHDGAGRFVGYIGSARPVGEADAAEFGRAALARLLPALDDAVLLFRRAGEGSPWRLTEGSPGWAQDCARASASELDGAAAAAAAAANAGADADADAVADSNTAARVDWDTACARLPAPVALALAQMQAGETREIGDWRVRWRAVVAGGDTEAGRLLVLRKIAPAAAIATPTLPAVPAAMPAPTSATTSAGGAAPGIDAADHESFVYTVSHDLRAPIRVVEGFARILKEDYGRFLDRIGNDHTDRILAAAARMNSMIDALLALSRLQSQPLKRQPVDLSQLTRYILEDLRSAEPERDTDIQIEPGLVVQGDPTLMRIAIENLIGNAWKYSGQAARTRIELRREVLAGQATFVVADGGAGFDMRFADRLFGVFQRLHSAKDFQGTGVGLASVRRIIRRHGGDIWAESEVGQGARFYFTIP